VERALRVEFDLLPTFNEEIDAFSLQEPSTVHKETLTKGSTQALALIRKLIRDPQTSEPWRHFPEVLFQLLLDLPSLLKGSLLHELILAPAALLWLLPPFAEDADKRVVVAFSRGQLFPGLLLFLQPFWIVLRNCDEAVFS